MTDQPRPVPQLERVRPYVPGEAPKATQGRTFKLASNENPLGASPKARAAYQAVADRIDIYPDGGGGELRAAIADRYGLEPERLVLGAGSDEVFLMIGRAFLAPGDEMIATRHAFAIYAMIGQQCGASVIEPHEIDYRADVDAILAAVTERTRVVWLANPNNPTGTYLPSTEIARLHRGLPASILLVLDGAYAEFVEREDYDDGIDLARSSRNVIVTRTFSKLYGLAGLRVGWGYGPQNVIDALERVRMPFNVNLVAQAAAAAAIADRDFVAASLAHNRIQRDRLTAGLQALGLDVIDGVGNFAVARFPATPGTTAADALAYLKARGVTVRGLAGYRMPDHLRISVGTEEAMTAVLAHLADFLEGR
jgi:histidinol-phosphate aminotransferase